MRRIAIAAAAVAAAGLALSLAALSAGSSSSQHPALRLVETSPLHLAGVHFRSHERVRVTVTVSRARNARILHASGDGSFLARLAFRAGRCSAMRAVAVGSAGSRAMLKRVPLPACMLQ
jgi:hypothetical protein